MHWKLKSFIQNAVSRLPSEHSYAAYYWIQRHFGGLKRMDPTSRLKAGVEACRRLHALGRDPNGKSLLEVGTGRVPLVPLAFWLMGARRTVTVDLNPYMKEELIRESLEYIAANRPEIEVMFGNLLIPERLDELLALLTGGAFSQQAFLTCCNIDYMAPGDAADTRLPEASIDFHLSYTVFEHIPRPVLEAILKEGNRILHDDGLFIHRIDYSDHFSHADSAISAVNFLQFPEAKWERLAGNRYMYMNRLRHADYLRLFTSAGHQIVLAQPETDAQSLQLLKTGALQPHARFASYPPEELAITASWIVSAKTPKQDSGS